MKSFKQTKKTIEIVSGPNGSGKTTFAESFIIAQRQSPIFINSDTIALGISPADIQKAAFQAGRIMLQSIKDGLHRDSSIAFESTLSGRTWLPMLKNARRNNYRLVIYFIFLNSIRDNLRRIQMRVKAGGHFIPTKTVKRRYPRAFNNFWKLYRPLCNDWYIFNNSGQKPILVISKNTYDRMPEKQQSEFSQSFLKRRIIK